MKYKFSIVLLGMLLCGHVYGQQQKQLMVLDGSSLSERWLIKNDSAKTFRVLPYKPVYVLGVNHTDNINNLPQSDNPLNVIATPTEYIKAELTFQLSFKTRMVRLFKNKKQKVDLWVAYTQLSKWQFYNALISRPFRETNYEPEVLMVLPMEYKFLGLDGVYMAIGFNHQSNGRSNPFSRSWNRVMFQAGWESENWSIVLNPWIRLQEDTIDDNNPNIENYVGRAELLSAFSKNRHNISLALRHSLNGGNENRGSLRLDYAIQILDYLHLHAQVFHGYGESLIDYNHKQTTFGIGFSLVRWR
ncbi:phospholipase A [Flagellimonas sp. S3867]|uniref:phospholipase A n=1 Tax=Flagellimonas sp. S3867 TaxID=2768063 RepID=UPI0016890D3B|nr:phospholipase A [Flagellimonas sp. S3867]